MAGGLSLGPITGRTYTPRPTATMPRTLKRVRDRLKFWFKPSFSHAHGPKHRHVAESQAASNLANYKASLAAVNVARENWKVAQAQKEAAAAQVEATQAAVQNAELQLSYTVVCAPSDGRVSQKTFEVGQHVQAGQTGLSIAEPGIWILANFKENQLGRIRPGQAVEIHVDAISHHTFQGTVDSFQSGTGAVYALLPPDNATGNFTKIVQRVPVKIRFEPASIRGYEQLLVPGVSTEPTIRLKNG